MQSKSLPLTKAQRLSLTDTFFHSEQISIKAQSAINEAKRRDRPSLALEDWSKDQYHKKGIVKDLFDCPDDIARREMDNLSEEEFKLSYIAPRIPVVIKDCTSNWKSSGFWTFNSLAKLFSEQLFKIGEDDDGLKIKTTMKNFIEYLVHNQDDSPLYLFQNTNMIEQELAVLLQNYQVPLYFQEDLLCLLQPEDRPPFRWFLMGPERSGSTVHTDPMMTCAWNTSLVGHKRWVIFKKDLPKYIAKGKEFRSKDYKDEAINYFIQILPRIKQKYSKKELGMMEFIQYPGETVFVPCGAWHAVLNLDDTIAVTQNFMSFDHFDEGWKSIIEQRKYLAPKLLKRLQQEVTDTNIQKKDYYYRAKTILEQQSLSGFSESEENIICQRQLKSFGKSLQETQQLKEVNLDVADEFKRKKSQSLKMVSKEKNKSRARSHSARSTLKVVE